MMERLGERGDIDISEGGCNADLGHNGLEIMPHGGSYDEYLDVTGRHKIDIQLNIQKFGEQMHNGLLNTKEMAHKWNWKSDCDELNWRNKPCALRIGYNKGLNIFKVQVWNDLLQIWIKLALTKEDILEILGLEGKQRASKPELYCDSIKSEELEDGIKWTYFRDGKAFDTAFMSYKQLYGLLSGKYKFKCQFCNSTKTEKYQPRDEDTAINLCEQHEKYIQRISQKIHGNIDEV